MDDLGPVRRDGGVRRPGDCGGERWRLQPLDHQSQIVRHARAALGPPSRSEGRPAVDAFATRTSNRASGSCAHPAADRTILTWLHRTRFAESCTSSSSTARFETTSPGPPGWRPSSSSSSPTRRSSSSRDRADDSRSSKDGSPIFQKSKLGRHAESGRDRAPVARGSLSLQRRPDPGRCVVWTRWPVARRTPRYPSIIPHRCASQSPPAAATPRVSTPSSAPPSSPRSTAAGTSSASSAASPACWARTRSSRSRKNAVRGIAHLGGTILRTTNRGNPFHYPRKQPDGTLHRGATARTS